MKIDFKGKKVLISGGSRGIGAACVNLFCQAGADVAFTYLQAEEESSNLVNKYSREVKIKAYKADLNKPELLAEVIQKISDEFSGIDILVNNAGIWEYGAADEMELEEWEKTLRVNLSSMFIITRSVIPGMKKNNYGRIINVSSTAGQRGEAYHSHYAASKGGMISYTKSLAAELGRFNINVNSVAPGWVLTDMCTGVFADEEYKEKVRKDIPLQRIATAEDIAGPILFLATEFARHINGEILNVNGGSVLCG
jgi:3-oxoacyl-[acyl-carrier protein] reductase